MSKGWESKNVEEQQAEAAGERSGKKPEVDHDARRAEAEHKRKRQALDLQREHILSQRTSSPHRRTALTDALNAIELEIEKLGNTIHI